MQQYSGSEHIALDLSTAEEYISLSKETNLMVDSNYNDRGIKRISCSVSQEGSFAGILSLALIFTPTLENKIKEYMSQLKITADSLGENI